MIDPIPSISVTVDPTNPGEFFACCGLLELADRLWPGGAEGWFEAGRFLLRRTDGTEATLAHLIQAVSGVKLRQLDLEDDMSSPVELPRPFALRLDWWQEKGGEGRASPLKVWAGAMRNVRIARAMLGALARPELQTEDLFAQATVVYDTDEPEK